MLISSTGLIAQESDKNNQTSNSQIEATSNTPEERANIETNRMVKMLGLSKNQKNRVSILNLKVEEKIEVIRMSKMVEEKKDEFIQGNLKDRMNVLSTILTEEQMNKYKASFKK